MYVMCWVKVTPEITVYLRLNGIFKKSLESLLASVVRTYGYYFENVLEFIGKQKTLIKSTGWKLVWGKNK